MAIKLTKEARDALAPEQFAVPDTRDLPLHDSDHVKWAWNNIRATKGLSSEQRAEARRRTVAAAKEFKLDTSDWEKTSVAATAVMQAKSLNMPKVAGHPNRMPFQGVLTRIGEPSDAAPEGSGGRRVMLTAEAAARALDSLLGMAVDFTPELDGHDPQAKIGVITDATIEGNAICVEGFLYAADFPEVSAEIKANKDVLGMSFEARDLFTNDADADPIPIVDCVFTGAAILFKDKAAYTTTSINAARAAEKEFTMDDNTKKEIAALLADAIKPVTDAVAAQAAELKKVQEAGKVEAANHLAKVEKHASELEKAADHMDAAGIGGHPSRGHAAILRNMAGDLRAKAARGEMPSSYDSFYASAAQMQAGADEHVKKAVDSVKTELTAQIDGLKAAAAKAETAANDAAGVAETKIKDLQAQLEKAKEGKGDVPSRKTLSPGHVAMLSKTGISAGSDGKVDKAKLDEVLAKSQMTPMQRIELKTALANAEMID